MHPTVRANRQHRLAAQRGEWTPIPDRRSAHENPEGWRIIRDPNHRGWKVYAPGSEIPAHTHGGWSTLTVAKLNVPDLVAAHERGGVPTRPTLTLDPSLTATGELAARRDARNTPGGLFLRAMLTLTEATTGTTWHNPEKTRRGLIRMAHHAATRDDPAAPGTREAFAAGMPACAAWVVLVENRQLDPRHVELLTGLPPLAWLRYLAQLADTGHLDEQEFVAHLAEEWADVLARAGVAPAEPAAGTREIPEQRLAAVIPLRRAEPAPAAAEPEPVDVEQPVDTETPTEPADQVPPADTAPTADSLPAFEPDNRDTPGGRALRAMRAYSLITEGSRWANWLDRRYVIRELLYAATHTGVVNGRMQDRLMLARPALIAWSEHVEARKIRPEHEDYLRRSLSPIAFLRYIARMIDSHDGTPTGYADFFRKEWSEHVGPILRRTEPAHRPEVAPLPPVFRNVPARPTSAEPMTLF